MDMFMKLNAGQKPASSLTEDEILTLQTTTVVASFYKSIRFSTDYYRCELPASSVCHTGIEKLKAVS